MEQIEEWRPVAGFEGLYEAGSLGNIKSLSRKVRSGKTFRVVSERILKPRVLNTGYEYVDLCSQDGHFRKLVHVLVCAAFHENPEGKEFVDHIDGNRRNNRAENLRWCTRKENNNFDLYRQRQSESKRGTKHPCFGKFGSEHPSSKPVAQYSKNGEFICEFAGISEAYRRTGVPLTSISKCCLGRPNHATAGGYIWRFINKEK